MPRQPRYQPAGMVFHVINRGVGRQAIFHKDQDYTAFQKVMAEAQQRVPIRLLSYCLMPNHWHLVLWPRTDDQVSEFTKWLTHTHTQRYHAHYHTSGTGHLYQGRYKSFPVQGNHHLLLVLRYVERNALRAGLVPRAQDWLWSSLWQRQNRQRAPALSNWPLPPLADWLEFVNEPQTSAELQAIRASVNRGSPFGDEKWQEQAATTLGLQATQRPRGRPRKVPVEEAK